MGTDSQARAGFEAIPRGQAVARQLARRITEGMTPEDLLPPARDLVQMRDAMRRLQLMGQLEPRQGIGTLVTDPAAAHRIRLLQRGWSSRERSKSSGWVEPARQRRPARRSRGRSELSIERDSEKTRVLFPLRDVFLCWLRRVDGHGKSFANCKDTARERRENLRSGDCSAGSDLDLTL